MEEQNVTTASRSDPVKPVEASAGPDFSNKFTARLLSCDHAGFLGPLKPFHHPFPLAVSASCHGVHSSAKSLQEAQAEPESTQEGAIAMRRCLLLCRIMVQTLLWSAGTIPSPNVRGCPLSKTNTLSPWQAGTCMTQGLLERTKSVVERTL